MRIKLPHGESDTAKRYSMPDPDALGAAVSVLYRSIFYHERPPTREELIRVVTLAQGYLDLTTYELGQEHCAAKLRDIWRARRATGAE